MNPNEKKDNDNGLEPTETQNMLKPNERDNLMPKATFKDYIYTCIVGIVVSVINISINIDYRSRIVNDRWQDIVWGYLIIIFLVIIPAVIFGLKKRPMGYGYIFGYIIGGFIEVILPNGDIWIGSYTIFVSIMLYLIIMLIFKIWRSFSAMKIGS